MATRIDHAAIAHSTRAQLQENQVKLARYRADHSSLLYAANAGDTDAKASARNVLTKIKALEETIAEQHTVIAEADRQEKREQAESMGAVVRRDCARAMDLADRRVDLAGQVEDAVAKVAALCREYAACGMAAHALVSQHVGHERSYVFAPVHPAELVTCQLIHLAEWHEKIAVPTGHMIGESLQKIAQLERDRMAQRLPVDLSKEAA
jgi:hypothetical protein